MVHLVNQNEFKNRFVSFKKKGGKQSSKSTNSQLSNKDKKYSVLKGNKRFYFGLK